MAHQDCLQETPTVQLLPALPVVTRVRAQESGRVVIVAALLAALLAAAIEDKQLRQISTLDTSVLKLGPRTTQGSSFISLGAQRETKEVRSYLMYNRHEWFKASSSHLVQLP